MEEGKEEKSHQDASKDPNAWVLEVPTSNGLQSAKDLDNNSQDLSMRSTMKAVNQLNRDGFISDVAARRIRQKMTYFLKRSSPFSPVAKHPTEKETTDLLEEIDRELEKIAEQAREFNLIQPFSIEETEEQFRSVNSRVNIYQRRNKRLKEDTRKLLSKLSKVVEEL